MGRLARTTSRINENASARNQARPPPKPCLSCAFAQLLQDDQVQESLANATRSHFFLSSSFHLRKGLEDTG